MNATPTTSPVGGDPAKPGAWTPAQIAAWNKVADCDHVVEPKDDSCARCGAILRTDFSEPEPVFDAGDDVSDSPYGNKAVAGA